MTTSILGSTVYSKETSRPRDFEISRETAVRSREVTVTAPQDDTVTLSISNEIETLLHEGVGVAQIANTLGLTTDLVNSYLYEPTGNGTSEIAVQA